VEAGAVLRRAAELRVAVTAAGAGTGLAGGRVPRGGWLISLRKLRRLDISPGFADVGSGVLLRELHAAAAASNQLYPPDPTETGASVGGTIATNASGSRSFRYGATRRWVESLRVALANGELREFRRGEAVDFDLPEIPLPAVTKNTAGYLLRPGMDWVDLFAGSEGTLGVILGARLRLLPAPPAVLAGVLFFPADELALDAVDLWRRSARPRMLEYMDASSLSLLRARFPEIPAQAAAALLIDQDLTSEDDPEVDAWADRIEAAGALVDASWFATAAAERERFRAFRHALPELVNDTVRRLGVLKMHTDYAVPVARSREILAYYRERLEREFPGQHMIFGHIGDAHVHVEVLPLPAEQSRAAALITEFARQVVALGGTVSAEHGLGKRKAHLLALQYRPEHLEAMRAVKRRLDPANLLGQGTLFGS
jgi:FAD/FMN-containing dehydrogenase